MEKPLNWCEDQELIKLILESKINNCDLVGKPRKKDKDKFIKLNLSWDIETTRIDKSDEKHKEYYSYMYIWQSAIDTTVVIGRTWDQFKEYIDTICDMIPEDLKIICWVHNLSYEMSFFLPRYYEFVSDGFYMEKRQPIYVVYKDCIRFQDSALISGCSLDSTAKEFKLKTKKLKGDLDYNIPRNSKTILDEKTELQYCINDVLILTEFSDYIYNELVPKNYNKIPLTKTQLVLNDIFHNMTYGELKQMGYCRPSFEEYTLVREWLYRGGYVHGNSKYCGKLIENVDSVDFTSSYPSVMLKQYVPVTKFYSRNIRSEEDFNYYLSNYCCYFQATFTNLKAKTNHSIESLNKCMEYSGVITDNGRVYKAETITVLLTELDYKIYELFYDWDSMDIYFFKVSKRGLLPKGLRDTVRKYYIDKATLKNTGQKDTTAYSLAKALLNASYGATVKKINLENWSYKNGQWQLSTEGTAKEIYDKQNKKLKVLSTFYGIWVTSQARYNLLSSVAVINDDVLYNDTDSIKMKNSHKYKDFIDQYNKHQEELNNALDDPIFTGLGYWDLDDGHYSYFKHLGSKRYAYIDKEDNSFHTTISGLKKGVIKSMDDFENGHIVNIIDANKVTSRYNDNYHEDYVTDLQGNTELMSECGSCALYNVGFNLSLSNEYKEFLEVNYGREKITI